MKLFIKIILWFFTILFALFSVVFILNILPWTPSKIEGENLWRKEGGPLIIPHGGAKSLYPENTIRAFNETSNYDVFEIDLALTKDGYLISHHDLDMGFTTGVETDLINNYTYDEIVQKFIDSDYYLARNFKNMDGQYPYQNLDASLLEDFIPVKLSDMFTNYNDFLYILEIKDTEEKTSVEQFRLAAERLAYLIDEYEMHDKVIVASFDDNVVDYYRSIDKKTATASGWNESLMFIVMSAFDLDFFYNPKAHALILPNIDEKITGSGTVGLLNMLPPIFRNRIVTKIDDVYHTSLIYKNLINDAHRKNMAILYWTVNDPDEMRKAIDAGADGIITDYPNILKQILDEEYS